MKRKYAPIVGKQKQQRLTDNFISKSHKPDGFQDVGNWQESQHLSFTGRLISGTEGADGNAFTTLMKAVATRKPVITFVLNLDGGKLFPEIKLNSDRFESVSRNRTSTSANGPDIDAKVDGSANIKSSDDGKLVVDGGLQVDPDSVLWARECRLRGFNFNVQSDASNYKSTDDVELRIQTNILPKANAPEDHCDGFPIHHSLLKSMLQKAVRRRLTDSAVRLSLALAHVSTIELLRRLPIICLEDGGLHPAFPVLVWCMLASSKGYLLPDYLLSVCVHIIAEVSECPYRDSLFIEIDSIPLPASTTSNAPYSTETISPSRSSSSPAGSTPVKISTHTHNASLPHKRILRLKERDIREEAPSSCRTLVLSLMLRAAFGGLEGDVTILNKYAFLWFNRFFRHDVKTLGAEVNPPCMTSETAASPSSSSSSSPHVALGGARAPSDPSSSSYAAVAGLDVPFYMQKHWVDSSFATPWGRLCLNFSSSPSPSARLYSSTSASADIARYASDGANSTHPAFTLLRSYIIKNMQTPTIHCSLLSLFSPHKSSSSHQSRSSVGMSLNLLLLRSVDLIPEGIDFHCDGEIVHAVQAICGSELVSKMRINVDRELVASSMLSKARASIKGHFTAASSSNSSCTGGSGISSSSCGDSDDTETVFADLCSSQAAQVDAVIKSAIWVFRSSINNHRLWPPSLLLLSPTSPGPECRRRLDYDLPLPHQASARGGSGTLNLAAEQAPPVLRKEQSENLKKKEELAPYWKMMCPAVKACCEARKRELEWRLAQYYKLHSLSLNPN